MGRTGFRRYPGGRQGLVRATLFAGILLAALVAGALWMAGPALAQEPRGDGTPATPPEEEAVVIGSTASTARVRVSLPTQQAAQANAEDFGFGPASTTPPTSLALRPVVTSVTAVGSGAAGAGQTFELAVGGLTAFGETSVMLRHKGRDLKLLRFLKPGLLARPLQGDSFVVRGSARFGLQLRLENPSGLAHHGVAARVRFEGVDVCRFKVDLFQNEAAPPAAASAGTGPGVKRPGSPSSRVDKEDQTDHAAPDCLRQADWDRFDLPPYAQATLQAEPAAQWFVDAGTGRVRKATRQGTLTLRWAGEGGVVHEQNLPLEVSFEPDPWRVFRTLLWVGALLLGGALLSLLIRVIVPNYKRKRALRDQLHELARATARISNEVPSDLRVLLRVERLALDATRADFSTFGPSYAEVADRVEAALPVLKRRIDAARRLDTALLQRRVLLAQAPAPTRLEQTDQLLTAAAETLMQEQLSDEDWVFANQRMEAAQKLLREPTPTEKEAFEALLSGRWKALVQHFSGAAPGVVVPPAHPAMQELKACFPTPSLLPKPGDGDGTEWIGQVGPVRADLQLTALSLLWELEFLLPSDGTVPAGWDEEMAVLKPLLATPTVGNLLDAKLVLRRMAERIAEKQIIEALMQGEAWVAHDPQLPRPQQKIRFAVCFRQPHLNTAAARERISCRWTFSDRHVPRLHHVWSRVKTAAARSAVGYTQVHEESGWTVHHYFEGDVQASEIVLTFHDSKGREIVLPAPAAGSPNWAHPHLRVTPSGSSEETWSRLGFEAVQLAAVLFVPLAALASSTMNGSAATAWWELVALGFASETIKGALGGSGGK